MALVHSIEKQDIPFRIRNVEHGEILFTLKVKAKAEAGLYDPESVQKTDRSIAVGLRLKMIAGRVEFLVN